MYVMPPWARRDTYERNVYLYWIEVETTGSYEKECLKENTRSLKLDMGDEGWENNDEFGYMDMDDGVDMDSHSSNGSNSDDDQSQRSHSKDRRSRRRKSGQNMSDEDRTTRRRRGGSFSREDPLEASFSCHDHCDPNVLNIFHSILNGVFF